MDYILVVIKKSGAYEQGFSALQAIVEYGAWQTVWLSHGQMESDRRVDG